MLLIIIYYIFLLFTVLYCLYFLIMGLFGFKKLKSNDKKKTKKDHYFEIIIPVRNEGKVIGNLIKSLEKLNYLKEKYGISVIVNNCTDNTLEVVSRFPVNIVSCEGKISSKGEALKYTFDVLKAKKKIDYYVIFDADNIVHPDFLKYMNESANSGYLVAQCFRDSKNISDNWLTGSYALFYFIQNFFFNGARKRANMSASINGTGFMISKEMIDTLGFNVLTLTEDVEFTGICAINNIKIDFVDKAITYDEQPSIFRQSWKQRKRWSKGNLQCFKIYVKDLLKHFFIDKNFSCIDMLLTYLAPIIQLIACILIMISFLIRITDIKLDFLLLNEFFVFFFLYLFEVVISIFVILYNGKDLGKLISSAFLFGLFMFSWIPINVICLFKKDIKWDHIEHNKVITIEEIVDR